ncbi:MAG: aldehyde dehydrogenase family protein [Luteolibacter sp.]|jgi:acyl-CoA reductase-like NAD-dependent aldehyde dehydrogenase
MPLKITKTPKCYVGGAFIRSESGRVAPLNDASGAFLANIPQCSRKDLRNAVEAAAKAASGWAARNPYNRGQILYRLAEMMESRADELTAAIAIATTKSAAAKETRAAIERVVHYAGWTDKYQAVLGSVNPVATPHFNFTIHEPMGVVGIIAPDQAPLLGLLTLILPAITSGNTVVALASNTAPYPAILLGEMLAVSDIPGGTVNILTGDRTELLPTFATHAHLRALGAAVTNDELTVLEQGASDSVKRVVASDPTADWFSDDLDSPYRIADFLEAKTVWHPIGS